MTVDSVEKLFVKDLKDLYVAESEIVNVLPKLINAASSEDLKAAFEDHLGETEDQLARLDEVFTFLGLSSIGGSSDGVKALLAEGAEIIGNTTSGPLRDAALIAAAQRVEYYEISAYGSVLAYAQIMGLESVMELLEDTLREEKAADKTLTAIAESINLEALGTI
jgi:ferritin-like metal-binding protein YciE